MKKTLYLVFILGVLFITGCTDNRETAFQDLEMLTQELATGTDNYTQEDWDIANDQFEKICEEIELHEYTDEELKKIGKLKGVCLAVFAKRKATEFKRSIHRIGKQVEGFIEAVEEASENKDEE